jgi:hypothetical protein
MGDLKNHKTKDKKHEFAHFFVVKFINCPLCPNIYFHPSSVFDKPLLGVSYKPCQKYDGKKE